MKNYEYLKENTRYSVLFWKGFYIEFNHVLSLILLVLTDARFN